MQNTDFYASLLNFGSDWKITHVDVHHDRREVEVFVEYQLEVGRSPETGELCPIYDHREVRSWRHLDTMQYKTFIRARVPRVRTPSGEVVTIRVPWAEPSSRHSLLFESWAIELLLATKNKSETARLLRLSWDQLQRIMDRAVERGLAHREEEFEASYQAGQFQLTALAIDEKCYRRGRQFVTVVSDPQNGRVLEVAEGRTSEATQSALESALSPWHLRKIEAVSVDLAASYRHAVERVLPQARIVYDKFHLMRLLSDAIDQTRREEVQEQEILKKTRFLWLKPADRLSQREQDKFERINQVQLRTAEAWRIRENYRAIYATCRTWKEAFQYFLQWKKHAQSSLLRPIRTVVRTFEQHLDGILSYFDYPISNARAERLNGKIQEIIVIAKGFRSLANLRVAILFFTGNLKLLPQFSQ